ncbi:hypothetical protein BHE74_00029079, partial [Ensete ventricosum]
GGRLEATAAAREDGFRLWSHDREEEWAMVTQLRAGRQQWQRRRQRLWLVMAATAGKRLGSTGSDSYSGEAVGKRRRQWGPARATVAREQRGPTRKRGRKVRRVRLEQRPRRGMADWKRLRLWLRRRGDGGLEEKEAAGSGEGCDSERAAGSGEEAREEGEEGTAGVAAEEVVQYLHHLLVLSQEVILSCSDVRSSTARCSFDNADQGATLILWASWSKRSSCSRVK